MRCIRLMVLAAVVALGLTITAAVAQDATPPGEAEPRWLFVQAFEAATLAPDPAAPDTYVLTLSGVDEAVLAFTDHPDRLAMTVPTAEFAAAVQANAADPLNATLVAPLVGGEPAMVVVELLDAAPDAAAGTITYRVVVLDEEVGPLRAEATPLAAPADEQSFDSGHLFVDDVCASRPGHICL